MTPEQLYDQCRNSGSAYWWELSDEERRPWRKAGRLFDDLIDSVDHYFERASRGHNDGAERLRETMEAVR